MYNEHVIYVNTYDVDFAGHVSNISYLRWLEEMRLRLFDQYCPLKSFTDQGLCPVLASTEIKYKKPVRLYDQPLGKMWVSSVGRTSIVIEAEIYVGEVLTTTARHVGVFVDLEKTKPVAVPSSFLAAYEQSK